MLWPGSHKAGLGLPGPSPGLRWNYTRRSQLGSSLGQGREGAVTSAPSPSGLQALSPFHKSLGPWGPAWASRDQMSPAQESLCVRSPQKDVREEHSQSGG